MSASADDAANAIAAAIGLIYYLARHSARGSWIVGALVVSHWVLDFVSHRPDMPLWPGGPRFGLGLWNSWTGSITVEVLLFGAAIWLYLKSTRPRDAVGVWAFWGLVVLLSVGWAAALLSPPPPEVHQLALGSLTIWITVPWGWWADRHRDPTRSQIMKMPDRSAPASAQ